MEAWDREALYLEVWSQPLTKLAKKYHISNVMLGKICRKLKIPLPGRGYWAKKEFGKTVKQPPLPAVKDLPPLYRSERREAAVPKQPAPPQPEPTDAEYLRVKNVESRALAVSTGIRRHALTLTSQRILREARADGRGILQPSWEALDIRVSKNAVERALTIMNAVITSLEDEKFRINLCREKHNTRAQVFGHAVPFAIVEKYREKGRKEVQEASWRRWEIEYQPTGELEFQVGQDRWGGWRCRDGKRQRLEDLLPAILGAIMREGRERMLQAERDRLRAIEDRKKEMEMLELRREIEQEEKKVAQLDAWVTAWLRAGQMRDFIVALEKLWAEQGLDLSPSAEKGQRITWMKQQADRLDPMVPEKPPSILDRIRELGYRP